MFVKLEKPALEQSEAELRTQITIAREQFLNITLQAFKLSDENRNFLSKELELYEEAAQQAVEGNLALIHSNDDDDPFPSKAEKWTLMQAIFFASTVCTTIGKFFSIFILKLPTNHPSL